jgi:hypothetical protein
MRGAHSGNGKGWHPFDSGVDSNLFSKTFTFYSPIHFWPMNEGTGTAFVDHIGTTNFTLTNVAWATFAGLGSAAVASFLGGGTSYAIANAYDATLDFNGLQPLSWNAWINVTTAGSFFGNLEGNYGGGWEIGIYLGSTIAAFIAVSSGSSFLMNYFNVAPTGGHMLTVTYDGSNTNAGLLIYLDGVLQATSSYAAIATPPVTSAAPCIMGQRYADQNYYTGGMAFMRVWSKVLTPTQISAIYAKGPQ